MTEDIHTIDPFGEDLAEDMAEVELLLSFLTYRYGLDLGPELKAAMEREENLRRIAELKKRTEKLEGLRRRMERDGVAPEEYILQLEKQVRSLQHEADRMGTLYDEIEERKTREGTLTQTVDSLTARIDEMTEEAHCARMAHAEALREALQRHEEEKIALNEAHKTEINELRETHLRELTAREDEAEVQRARHREELDSLHHRLAEQESETADMREARDELMRENRILRARLLGKEVMEGTISAEAMDSMTEKENFDDLERELEAFVELYERVWKQTKKKIRKDLINLKYIKGQSGK